MSRELIEHAFPHLARFGYQITSPAYDRYNCVAWVAGDTTRWWQPVLALETYWPPDAPLEWSVEALTKVFGTLGYVRCETSDLEEQFEKVAIYVALSGAPTHVARQLPTGRWTSKLSYWEDIEHTLIGLSGTAYGTPTVFMKRLRAPANPGAAP